MPDSVPNGPSYSWIPSYVAIADKLLEYANDWGVPFELVQEITGSPFDTHNCHGLMDPCTFFAMFNGLYRNDDKRREVVAQALKKFGLDAPVPCDFKGAPVFANPMCWWFYGSDGAVQACWDLTEAAVAYADDPAQSNRMPFLRAFDRLCPMMNVKMSKATGALHCFRPDFFLALDNRTRRYVNDVYRIHVPVKYLTGIEYLAIMDKVRSHTDKSLSEVSYDAQVAFPPTPRKRAK